MRAMDTKMYGLVSVDQNTKVKKASAEYSVRTRTIRRIMSKHYANQNYCSDKSSTQGS